MLSTGAVYTGDATHYNNTLRPTMAAGPPLTEPAAVLRPEHEFSSVFHIFDEYAHHLAHRETHAAPRFDLEQHENSYEIFGEVPGVRLEDLTIEVIDKHHLYIAGSITRPNSLALEGSKDEDIKVVHPSGAAAAATGPTPAPINPAASAAIKKHEEDKEAPPQAPKVRHLISERRYGEFNRQFHFATEIKPDDVVARLHNGILHVSVPSQPRNSKHIKVDWVPDAYGPFML